MISRAIALAPQHPAGAWFFGDRAIGHFLVHHHEEAVSDARAAIKLRYGYLFGRVVDTATLAEMDEIEEARKELQAIRLHTVLLGPYTFSNEADRERLISALRMAGFGQ